MYQNKIKLISIDESLRSINYEAKKRKGKNRNCSLYKSETDLYKMWCGLMWCVRQCWEKCHVWKKRHMDDLINISHVFINDFSRYIATSCDLKKWTKSSFIFFIFFIFFYNVFFIFPLSSTHTRFKKENCFKRLRVHQYSQTCIASFTI